MIKTREMTAFSIMLRMVSLFPRIQVIQCNIPGFAQTGTIIWNNLTWGLNQFTPNWSGSGPFVWSRLQTDLCTPLVEGVDSGLVGFELQVFLDMSNID